MDLNVGYCNKLLKLFFATAVVEQLELFFGATVQLSGWELQRQICHRSAEKCELCRLPLRRIIAHFSNFSKSHRMRFLLPELTYAGDADEKQRLVVFTICLIKVIVNSFWRV